MEGMKENKLDERKKLNLGRSGCKATERKHRSKKGGKKRREKKYIKGRTENERKFVVELGEGDGGNQVRHRCDLRKD